jgi:hypothetical protein
MEQKLVKRSKKKQNKKKQWFLITYVPRAHVKELES